MLQRVDMPDAYVPWWIPLAEQRLGNHGIPGIIPHISTPLPGISLCFFFGNTFWIFWNILDFSGKVGVASGSCTSRFRTPKRWINACLLGCLSTPAFEAAARRELWWSMKRLWWLTDSVFKFKSIVKHCQVTDQPRIGDTLQLRMERQFGVTLGYSSFFLKCKQLSNMMLILPGLRQWNHSLPLSIVKKFLCKCAMSKLE